MSYLALARKWRPKNFADLVGQKHVVRALVNALDADRVHHAYLFSGTRGVGKTTIARILAKALNCESGVTAEPCGVCSSCQSIDEGRFVDLIEVDAASRTGVDDTRELLENVQYTPAAGRFKVYLIDEVHMLTKQSFNALLKTLEEPPPHIKFLLATTDPQKLPVTVLSRCLQFNLKRLPTQSIIERMEHICKAEKIKAEAGALRLIAQSASGSMRDALSLLDQALAFGGGRIKDTEVGEMLGSMDKQHLHEMLQQIAQGDAEALMAQIGQLHELVPDYESVLNGLASVLQQIAVVQLVGAGSLDEDSDIEALEGLAQQFSPEAVQLYYQIAVTGRRDISLAPDPHIGFEMTLLRMLSFRPSNAADVIDSEVRPKHAARPAAKNNDRSTGKRSQKSAPAKSAPLPKNADWNTIVKVLNLRGAVRQLAEHCAIIARSENKITLAVNTEGSILLTDQQKGRLIKALRAHLGDKFAVDFQIVDDAGQTIAKELQDKSAQQLQAAQDSIASDPQLKEIVDLFGAVIEPESIRPLDDGNNG